MSRNGKRGDVAEEMGHARCALKSCRKPACWRTAGLVLVWHLCDRHYRMIMQLADMLCPLGGE